MINKTIFTLAISLFISISTTSVYAAESKTTDDENSVVGACMAQVLLEKVPGMTQTKIEKCSDGKPEALPKCLGVSDNDFVTIVQGCKAQLVNAKCVAGKLKVTLIQYASCGYEKDPDACYKGLGTSRDNVVKLSGECEKEDTK